VAARDLAATPKQRVLAYWHHPLFSSGDNHGNRGTSRGVIKLTLRDGGYDWKFVPIADESFTDGGTGACHGPP